MRKYIVEFIGTFCLVLTIVVACNNGATGTIPAISIGLMLMAVVYAGGHISGAHYNPAVSLALLIRKKINVNDFVFYVVAQILGSVLASVIGAILISGVATGKTPSPMVIDIVPAFLAEFIGTFILVWVIQNVATAKANAGNSFYGMAIGLTVTSMAFALGPISGGAFNPAVAIGASVAEMFNWANLWVYFVACFGGAAAAALTYQQVVGEEA